ncbi:glucose-repressible protein Grg1 [Coleophoma crateriformis]|uniref:Glucose-repressible protein Grg1 n=1 Tax=Coleophoma crateriformis TaxID=565419 RepID=A0A3D8SXZ8_9HELO|nr:glucose-repressible protein Grg1 [Coleophoma crateriformis]
METIKHAGKYVTEKLAGAGAEGSKKANKEIAKDSHATVGTCAEAAKDAIIDKKDETKHKAKAEGHKECCKH